MFVGWTASRSGPAGSSAEWCLKAVDVCWNAKKGNIRPEERDAAAKAYEVARQAYRKILAEAAGD